jgi:hypothetical protein
VALDDPLFALKGSKNIFRKKKNKNFLGFFFKK